MPSESTPESRDGAGAEAGSSATADRASRLSRRACLAGAASLVAAAGCLSARTDDPGDPDGGTAPVARTETTTGYRLETTWTNDSVSYSAAYEVPRDAYRRARDRQPAFYSDIFDRARTAEASRTVTRSVVEAARASPVPRRLRGTESALVEVPTSESEPTRQVHELVAFEAVRTFLQSLPYGEDGETTGRMEYCRHVEETLVDGIGDCEDYTALAAGVFAQPPFEYDTVCVFLPEHITLGIERTDLPGAIREDVPERGTLSVGEKEYVFFDPVSDDPVGFDVEHPNQVEAVYAGDGAWRKLRPAIMAETLLRTGAEIASSVGAKIGGVL